MPPAPGRQGGDSADRARRLEAVLQRVDQLPTLSPIAARLLALSSKDDADFDQIIRLIEADPVLTGKILALCRRASSGVNSTVTTVRRAAVLLGLEAVQSAVLSLQIFDVLGKPPPQGQGEDASSEASRPFDRDGFWRHALAVACAAELLAEQHKALNIRPDEAFTAGLVHDLGKLALAWVLPQAYARVLALAEARGSDLAPLERGVLGLDHHVAGKRLAEHWSLPHLLQDAMWMHGQPAAALPDVPHKPLIGLVTTADALVRRLMLGWSGSCGTIPAIDELCRPFGLRLEAVRAIEPKLHETLAARCADLGLGQPTAAEIVLDSIGSANDRLGRLNHSLQERAQQARQHARALDLINRFAAGAKPGATPGDVLGELVRGVREAVGSGFFVGLFQSRAAERWSLITFDADAQPRVTQAIDPPVGPDGQPISLDTLTASALGPAVGLLTWLSENLPRGDEAVPDLRQLRILPLPSGFGPAAVLVHDRESLDDLLGPKGRASLERLGGWAVGAAAQHQGSRKLSEALAETTRVLNETQAKLTETQSLARLGELTAGAAHELNNPLTVISGKSQVLAQRLRSGRDAEDVKSIVQAAGKLTDLISALNFLADPPAPNRQTVGLDQLARDAIRLAQESARGKDSRTAVMVQVRVIGVLPDACADPAQLTRALAELIRNALESPARSKIEVELSRDEAEGGLRIRVRDDGPGLSPQALVHGFDPFFSEKPAGRQPGLGLPTARRLAELHEGRVSVLNAPGGGAVSEIVLPASVWELTTQNTQATRAPAQSQAAA